MNRLLLVVNAALALFLLVRALQSPVAAAAATAREIAAASLQVTPEFTADGRTSALVVDVGADLGPAGARGEPVQLGVRLDPPQPVLTSWRTPRLLAVVPATPLPRARRFGLVFGDAVGDAERGRIAAGTVVGFTTPPIAVLQVVPGGEGTSRPSVTVVFDQPVARDEARKCLQLRTGGRHERIACDVLVPGDAPSAAAITLRPRSNAQLPDELEVLVDGELVPVGGSVALAKEQVHTVRLRQPLRVVDVDGGDGFVDIALNRRVARFEPSLLRVEPAVAFQALATSRGLRLVGEFAPGSVVHVRVLQGFPGHGELRLADAAQQAVLMPDRSATLDFAQGGNVLCASAEQRLCVRGCNVEEPWVQLQRVYPNNLVRALQHGDEPTMAPAPTVPLPVVAARNERWTHDVDLTELVGGPLRGLYRVSLSHRRASYYPERRWLQVTDLGVTWRSGRGSGMVQVVDLVTGEPVAGAAVTVLTATNQELARGVTDTQGLLALQWAEAAGSDRTPFLVLAQRGDDVAFVGADATAVELADEELGGRAYTDEQLEAWVWPTRGIVRPGETIDAAVLVRDGRGLPRPGTELTACFTTPSGRVVAQQPLLVPGSGLMQASLALALDAPTGDYVLCVRAKDGGGAIGRASFRVEAFVPDRLEVEVIDVTPLRFGEVGTVRVRGRWLDGAPAAGRAVTARVRLLAHALQFPAAAGFTFASALDQAPPGELTAVHGELDAEGLAELPFALPKDAAQQGLLANVAIELEDPSGRVVRAGTSAPVQRPDRHLGVCADRQRCELVVLDGAGELLGGEQRATVRLEQRDWTWHYVPSGDGRWRWRTERLRSPIGEWNVMVRDGRASLELPPSDGDCSVVVTLGERTVEQALGDSSARPDRLRVRGPSEAVAAGGRAKLVVTSPAAGRGLVTFESDRVHSAVVVALRRGDTELDVPVPAGLQLPNVHAVVTLTRPVPKSGPDQGPAWLIGGTSLALARPDLRLPLTIAAPTTLQPDDPWRAQIDAPGATVALVALVDEGVLRITGHADPDPLAFLLAPRALATDGADTAAALLQRMQFAAGSKSGGDGDEGGGGLLTGSIDNRIRPYVRCARLELDGFGRGEVVFPLEGYEGRVRAMVVAAGPVGIGAARAETTVAAPLSVQLATPRMVAPGDVFTLPLTLRSRLPDGTVKLAVQAAGALERRGDVAAEVQLANGGETTLLVPVAALEPAPGESAARLVVRAQHGDVVREITAEFTVRTRTSWRQEAIGVDLAAGGELAIGDAWTQVEGVVRLDGRADPQLVPVLQRLLDYPFGCAEQTTSTAMALLAARTLLPRWFGPDDARGKNVGKRLDDAVARLLTMQTGRGGFGWWSGSHSDDPYVTAHVLEFLLAAREQGVVVEASALDEALARCQAWIAQDDDLGLRARLLDVLSLAGKPVQPWLDWVLAQSLDVDARLRLAAVLGRLGQKARAEALLGDDTETAPRRPAIGDLASPLRSQALRLRAWLAVAPQHERLAGLARGLQRAITAQKHATTQENVACFCALAEHYRRQPAPQQALGGSLVIDGVSVALSEQPSTHVLRAGSKLVFAAGGHGFALVELRGLHQVDDAQRHDRLALARTIVDVETGQPVTTLRRGRQYEVRIRVESDGALAQVAIQDLLPGGLEAEADPVGGLRFRTSGDEDEGEGGEDASTAVDAKDWPWLATRIVERRDDRVLFFLDRMPMRGELRHRVRATLPGSYAWPAVRGEAMYDPEVRGVGAAEKPLVVMP